MSNTSLKRKFDSSNEAVSVPNRFEVLNTKLSCRPDRHQLIEQGILYDSHCAPSLQHAEHALKRARLADELNNHLVHRPGPLDLIQHNILHIDTKDHPRLEQAIRGGEILFKPTSTSRRPLIFHEYTGPPSSCKPKVTKIESLSSSSTSHQVRLAQQQLLLELTSNKQNEQQQQQKLISTNELKDMSKQHQISSPHINKTKLIQRNKQIQSKINNQDQLQNPSYLTTCEINSNELLNDEILASLKINDTNDDKIELFSPNELDEILQSFPTNLTNSDQEQNQLFDLDFPNCLIDSQTTINNNDQLFVQMLLDNDYSSSTTTNETTTTFDDLFSSDYSSSLPKITTVDEFDEFLKDFTRNFSSNQQQVYLPIS